VWGITGEHLLGRGGWQSLAGKQGFWEPATSFLYFVVFPYPSLPFAARFFALSDACQHYVFRCAARRWHLPWSFDGAFTDDDETLMG
jgi:hypothetical protein